MRDFRALRWWKAVWRDSLFRGTGKWNLVELVELREFFDEMVKPFEGR